MNFPQLLNMLRKFPLTDLLNYPSDLSDKAAVRIWVKAVIDSLRVFTEVTATEIDDNAIKILDNIITSDATWDIVYSVLYNVFSSESEDEEDEALHNAKIDLIANKVGVSPTLIIIMIQAIISLLKFLRDRRN